MTNKPNRSHKSKKEQKRLEKVSTTKIVGEGRFVQRTRKPQKHGKRIKSVLIRVDAEFAAFCRKQARIDGSITEVTRKIYERIKEEQDKGKTFPIEPLPVEPVQEGV